MILLFIDLVVLMIRLLEMPYLYSSILFLLQLIVVKIVDVSLCMSIFYTLNFSYFPFPFLSANSRTTANGEVKICGLHFCYMKREHPVSWKWYIPNFQLNLYQPQLQKKRVLGEANRSGTKSSRNTLKQNGFSNIQLKLYQREQIKTYIVNSTIGKVGLIYV